LGGSVKSRINFKNKDPKRPFKVWDSVICSEAKTKHLSEENETIKKRDKKSPVRGFGVSILPGGVKRGLGRKELKRRKNRAL